MTDVSADMDDEHEEIMAECSSEKSTQANLVLHCHKLKDLKETVFKNGQN